MSDPTTPEISPPKKTWPYGKCQKRHKRARMHLAYFFDAGSIFAQLDEFQPVIIIESNQRFHQKPLKSGIHRKRWFFWSPILKMKKKKLWFFFLKKWKKSPKNFTNEGNGPFFRENPKNCRKMRETRPQRGSILAQLDEF